MSAGYVENQDLAIGGSAKEIETGSSFLREFLKSKNLGDSGRETESGLTLKDKYEFIIKKLIQELGEHYELEPVKLSIFDRKEKKDVGYATTDDFYKPYPNPEDYGLTFFSSDTLFRGDTPQRLEGLLLGELDKIELRPKKNEPNSSINWTVPLSYFGEKRLPDNAQPLIDEPLENIDRHLFDNNFRMPYSLAVGFKPGSKMTISSPSIDRGPNVVYDQINRIVTGDLTANDIKYIAIRFSGDVNDPTPRMPVVFRLKPKQKVDLRKAV